MLFDVCPGIRYTFNSHFKGSLICWPKEWKECGGESEKLLGNPLPTYETLKEIVMNRSRGIRFLLCIPLFLSIHRREMGQREGWLLKGNMGEAYSTIPISNGTFSSFSPSFSFSQPQCCDFHGQNDRYKRVSECAIAFSSSCSVDCLMQNRSMKEMNGTYYFDK